ncbi:MAG: DUF309 domain-containing protein [Candidatus Neomarinimicrobiota bacterium]
MTEEEQKEKLFQEGLDFYKSKDYFEAHESWENLWSDYYLEDRKFIQGLIQLSVSFVHLGNGNITGAKNLLRKSKEKFELFSGVHRNIDLNILLNEIEIIEIKYDVINSSIDFDWTLIPNLE